jgi:hypothetical protein
VAYTGNSNVGLRTLAKPQRPLAIPGLTGHTADGGGISACNASNKLNRKVDGVVDPKASGSAEYNIKGSASRKEAGKGRILCSSNSFLSFIFPFCFFLLADATLFDKK